MHNRAGAAEAAYSPECLEGKFCQLRRDGVLRSSTSENAPTGQLDEYQFSKRLTES
jgi:hypothetical protein